jgi:hypothetical protein
MEEVRNVVGTGAWDIPESHDNTMGYLEKSKLRKR